MSHSSHLKGLYAGGVRLGYWLTRPVSGLFLHNTRRVRVLVQVDDQILLLRSAIGSQRWSLPGGGVGKTETVLEAALRELREETGVSLPEDQLRCLGEERLSAARNGKGWPYTATVFYNAQLSKLPTTRIVRPLEILSLEWFKIDDLPESLNPLVQRALEMSQTKAKKS